MAQQQKTTDDALTLLWDEDRSLADLFERLDATAGWSVEERAEHGTLGKQLLSRLAIREAAKRDISGVLAAWPDLEDLAARFRGDVEVRRRAIDRVDEMARGVTGMDLNKGQDFDAAVGELRRVVEPELTWELDEGLPTAVERISPAHRKELFHDARYLRHHAPTHPAPGSRRWYERSGLLTRLVAAWDHLQDRPRVLRQHRAG